VINWTVDNTSELQPSTAEINHSDHQAMSTARFRRAGQLATADTCLSRDCRQSNQSMSQPSSFLMQAPKRGTLLLYVSQYPSKFFYQVLCANLIFSSHSFHAAVLTRPICNSFPDLIPVSEAFNSFRRHFKAHLSPAAFSAQ